MATSRDSNLYCFNCRRKAQSNNLEQVVLKNGRDSARCTCAICETTKFRMGKVS